jgi:hypothetical protein
MIPARFNGPPASGQGGYSAGALVAAMGRPGVVSLRRPVPLEEELAVRVDDGVARAFDRGGEVVLEAVAGPALAGWEGPMVTVEAARAAAARFVAPAGGTFDRCFVCGRARHDGFGVFPGPVEGSDLVAAPWTPPAWAAGDDGVVRAEFVWAALDCPGYFAVHGSDLGVAFLARQQVEAHGPVRAGVEYVAVGRTLRREGRKGFAATAILDGEGEVVAHSEQLLVAPRDT